MDEHLFDDIDIQEDTSKSHNGRFIIGIGLISIISIVIYFNYQKDEEITKPESINPTQKQQAISEESHRQVEQTMPLEEAITLKENAQEQEGNNELMNENESIVDNHLSQIVAEPDIEEDISDLQATGTDEAIETPLVELAEDVEKIEHPVIKEIEEELIPGTDEAIETPLVELAEDVEKIEHPVIKEIEEELIPETDDENIYNLETVPDFLSGVKGPNWLRQQPAKSYVLQLVSAQYMSNIKNLLNGQSSIQDQLSGYVKYTPSGKPRYLLLYGIYPNGKTAKAAINQLPIELKSTNPWPRTIDDVIKELDTVSEPSTEDELPEGISGFG